MKATARGNGQWLFGAMVMLCRNLMVYLQLIQFLINTVLGQQLLMRTLFAYFAFVHDHDAIRMLNGGEAVCYHDSGPSLHEFFQGFLNQNFRFGINVGGGFVHYKDTGFVGKSSCKG